MYQIILDLNKPSKTNKKVYSLAKLKALLPLLLRVKGENQVPFSFLKIFILYWSIVDQQCHISFTCTAKQLSHTYTCIYSFSNSFPIKAIRVLSRVPCAIQQVLVGYLF